MKNKAWFNKKNAACRVTPDCDPEDDLDASVLSLGLFPGEYLDRQVAGEDRTMFRFEAAWDSSLHNSLLLNRVTPAGETVYMTISAYLELESAFSPAIITKDLAMMVYGRGDGRIGPRIKNLFQGTFRDKESSSKERCLCCQVCTFSLDQGKCRQQARPLNAYL